MEAIELQRGRLIDHIQLVVADLGASRSFYGAVMKALEIPLGGEKADAHFWYDELFVSTPDGPEAAGKLTGRHHLAFQAKDHATVDKFYQAGLAAGGRDNGAPGACEPNITLAITPPSCSTLTAIISRRFTMARRSVARLR